MNQRTCFLVLGADSKWVNLSSHPNYRNSNRANLIYNYLSGPQKITDDTVSVRL